MPVVAPTVNLRLKSVLIATDFSQASEKPLSHALAIARCFGARFYLAHVVSSLGFTLAGPGAIAAAEEAASRDAAQLEDDLVRSGAMAGLQHHVVIRQGEVWPELEATIRQEKIDVVIVGTHGRRGMGKLLLGSVAEEVFRHADCLVLTVGPGAYEQPDIEIPRANRTFLLATDFGDASLHALPYAISFANQFEAKLVLLTVIPPIPMSEDLHWCTASGLAQMQDNARLAGLQRLEDLTRNGSLEVRPEFHVEFKSASPVSETILEVADRLRVDLIVMGLHRSAHIGAAAHIASTTAYEVVCRAGCPVLTVRGVL
jgi:nucleotide-binding universal stress UspA family protein